MHKYHFVMFYLAWKKLFKYINLLMITPLKMKMKMFYVVNSFELNLIRAMGPSVGITPGGLTLLFEYSR